MRFPLKSAVAAISVALLHTAALAADLRAPYAPAQNDDYPVELGTGWYIRGDLSYARENQPTLSPDLSQFSINKLRNGVAAGGGVGYQFNNWIRLDMTGEYRQQQTNNTDSNVLSCPLAVQGVTDANNQPIGIAGLFGQCAARQKARIQHGVALLNAYADLGHWWHVTPYVGAGVGFNYTRVNGQVNYFNMADGSPYDVTTSYPSGFPPSWFTQPVPIGHINWDRNVTTHGFTLAWALMAGVAYDLTAHAKLDVGYRYLNMGKVTGVAAAAGGPVQAQNTNSHEVRIGLRYVID